MGMHSRALNTSITQGVQNSPTPWTYPQKRLWLGITSVGLVVCLAALGWLAGYNARLLSALQEQGLPEISALVAVLFLYGIIMLPLDWLGGTRLPQEYQMSYGLSSWKYIKAVLLHGIVWFAATLLLHQAGTLGGLSGALLTMSLIMVAAFAFQWPLAQCIGSFHQEKPHDCLRKRRPTLEVHCQDPAFSGGIVGLPGKERFVLPASWRVALGADGWKTLIERRTQIHHEGLRYQGMIGAIAWNLIAFLIAAFLSGFPQQGMVSTLDFICISTVWHFIGLLIIPSWSQRATHHLDQIMRSHSQINRLLDPWIVKVHALVDGEHARKPWVEKIFHPTPSTLNRAQKARRYRWAPWHIARTMLYLSWFSGGLLSRSVHCNVGRPDLWVMTPTDG
jgi:hypothetical protein